MKTLLIPDIHEQLDVLQALAPMIDEAERIVCMGDYFDTWYERRQAAGIAEWIKERLGDKRFTFLLGNHDCHYAFNHPWFTCSGFSFEKKEMLKKILTAADWRHFKPFTTAGEFLVSHAGFRPETEYLATAERAIEALDIAFSDGMHPMFAVGHARGGYSAFGGPTWLDWNKEFAPIPRKQVVGHTFDKKHQVRVQAGSYCIDTGLHHVAWVQGGDIELVNIEELREQAA